MARKSSISLRDLEQETKKFLSPSTDKEKAIVEAAIALLGERGVDGATTAEIAKRAGVTEKTLFRYFPSKRDLINRVLFPALLRAGLTRSWEDFESLLKEPNADFKSWYSAFSTQRVATVGRNPALARTVLLELAQDDELREAVGKLWHQHIWRPMLAKLEEMKAQGTIDATVDVAVLARVIHSLNIGYFFARHVFAPSNDWDDAEQIEKMADILAHGCSARARKR